MLVTAGVLLALVALPVARAPEQAAAGELLGKRAPILDALDLDGRRWTLPDADGRLVWINFWATWCPPCRTEMPMMQRLHERYGDRVLILGVDFGEERNAVDDFVSRYGITYPILLDPTLENFYRWSPTFGLPKHYFVNADGVVVREIPGELPPSRMLETLDDLLREER
jgi:thiol-disulfide isomerase/thioredoxin